MGRQAPRVGVQDQMAAGQATRETIFTNAIIAREKSVRRCVPDIFSGEYSSVLYVGANRKRQHFLTYFKEAGYKKIVILEAFEENYKFLMEKFEARDSSYGVVWGKVQDVKKLQLGTFDVVFFWHGPEHLQESEIAPTLGNLEDICNHVVVCGMPFGFYEQGPEYGNHFEVHQSHIYPPFLERLGYKTETLGNPDQIGSNITAWKYLGG